MGEATSAFAKPAGFANVAWPMTGSEGNQEVVLREHINARNFFSSVSRFRGRNLSFLRASLIGARRSLVAALALCRSLALGSFAAHTWK
jgi:hypothetical protein